MSLSLLYFNIVSVLSSVAVFIIGAVVYWNDRKSKICRYWFLSCLTASLWSLFFFLVINATTKELSFVLRVLMDTAAILTVYFWLKFVLFFINYKNTWLEWGVALSTIFVLLLNLSPWFIEDMKPKYLFNYYVEASWGYYLFALYFIIIAGIGLYLLLKQKKEGIENRGQSQNVFWGSLAGFVGGSSSFLLSFNIQFPPYLFILFPLLPLIIGRGIIKYHLFNIKIVATELFTSAIWIFFAVKIILSKDSADLILNLVVLTAFSLFSFLLIKSVKQEVSQREKIEKLAEDLGKANERLKELDKQKTEFVSIASHQLRSPLTAIKGYSSMLLEGSFGPMPKKAKEAIDVIFQSSQKMISVIEDFLNITRIELGRMKYEMSDIDVGALARQVTEEQRPQVARNGLKLEFEDDGHDHNVYADMGKLNQVFNNLIDNATKYTEEGWIRVRVENMTKPEVGEVVRFVVKDSGVGIPPETLPKLFEKFVRAYDAGKVNLIGTGLGLYVAKQIVEGLDGKIWAESEGKGKGSTFIVELKHTKPLAEQEKEKKVVDFVAGI